MLYFGWAAETDGQHPFRPAALLFWVLPLGDPPGSDEAAFVWDALWYVRTYLWFVLLSPLLYPLFRRVGWPLLGVPLLMMLILEHGDFGMPASAESALWDLATYGACWLAGFAHRDGRLGRLHPAVAGLAFAALAGAGLYWLWQHHAETGWDFNEVSEAQAVYSLAFVLLFLRWQPPMDRIERIAPVHRLITLLNARAVTVYLWHGVAIAAVWPVLERTGLDDLGELEGPLTLAVTFALVAVSVLMFGWAEDLAARRRPRLWPAGSEPATAPEPVKPAVDWVGPIPAGWPETPRDADPGPPGDSDLPVAGRPVPGYAPPPRAGYQPGQQRSGYEGVPWSGHEPAPLPGRNEHY